MPLLFVGAVAWAAGTALGLTGRAAAALPLAAAAVAAFSLWQALRLASATQATASAARVGRWETPAGVALLAGAGALLGAELRLADQRCEAEAVAEKSWQLRLAVPAEPGSFVWGDLHRRDCRVRVAVAVRSGSAPAGSVVQVSRAEATVGDRGLLLRDASLRELHPPGPLSRWRNRVAQRLDARFGTDAGIVRALLIADTRALAPEIRERFTDAGLVHVLSISGLHVGIIGGALLLAVEALRIPARLGRVAALVIITVYVLAIGAPPPAVRSATLFAAVTATRFLQRPTSPWATFALGALVPLVEPRTVLALGWQLSIAGYAGILAAGRLSRRAIPQRWRGWRAGLARELAAGVLTTLTTAPLVAWHFGRLSLVSPLSNLVAGPLVALLQPTLFLAMLLPVNALADFAADAARPLLRALDATAGVAAGLPGAAVVVAPTLWMAAVSIAGATAVVVTCWRRHWGPPLTLTLGCLGALLWWPQHSVAPVHAPLLEVHLLDVGQGDAIALRTPAGRWILVDAGRSWARGDAGRATVIPYLRRRGGALAQFILTHPHADHVGGAASVIRALKPAEIRDAAFVAASPDYRAMLEASAAVGARWQRVRPGEVLEVDGVALEFLAPDSAWTVSLNDPNEASTIVRARYGSVRILLTGDAEGREEDWLLTHAANRLAADVLKVGHHGSATSSSVPFVDAVAPRLALVSVGRDNFYGHPSPDVMRRLSAAGATVLRTDQLGTVIIRTDGESLEVEAAGHVWRAARNP